ncbi:MAG: serine hydrolase [SAR202 cluster bacterium]|jgi:beta-lactamase class A|nr:serine hydrolase [SAR202 cluster bacterium]
MRPMAPSLPTQEMDRVADEFGGGVGFYVKDLATGTLHECNADQRFPTASICKIPVMIELFRQAEEGELSLLDRRRLKQPISAAGTGVLRMMEDDPELTLRDYCRLMIQASDNMPRTSSLTWSARTESTRLWKPSGQATPALT